MARHVENLKTKFAERGYPVEMVEENIQRGIRLERADLLKPKPVYPHQACPLLPGKRKFTPTFIITYNPHNPPLHQWLKQVHFILLADNKMEKAFPTAPTVSYRQARNLKQILVRSTLRELPYDDLDDQAPAGCYKHQHGARGGGSRRKLCKTSSPVHSQDYTTKCGTTLHAKAGTQCTS